MNLGVWLRRRLARANTGEQGSAVVEFVVLAVVLLVPLIYLVITVSRIQAGSYAVTAASREAGRAFVTAESGQDAFARAEVAADIAFEDQGFAGIGDITVQCSAQPCLSPNAQVETTARVTVPLPLAPEFMRSALPLSIPLSASHLSSVDRFRSAS